MAYFSKNQDGIERGAKIVADIACAVLLLTFSIVFFGLLGGVGAFAILEAALIGVDYLVPNEGDAPGAVVR
jgi:Mg2+/citrate symporter